MSQAIEMPNGWTSKLSRIVLSIYRNGAGDVASVVRLVLTELKIEVSCEQVRALVWGDDITIDGVVYDRAGRIVG